MFTPISFTPSSLASGHSSSVSLAFRMMEKPSIVTHVLSCSPEGELTCSGEVLLNIYRDLEQMQDSFFRFESLQWVICQALQEGNEGLAMDASYLLLRCCFFQARAVPAYTPFVEAALSALSYLCSSSNEYIWESASQWYGDYSRLYNGGVWLKGNRIGDHRNQKV